MTASHPTRLKDKVVIITGAGGAIGLETSARLLQDGARVSLVDISQDALEAAVEKLSKAVEITNITERIATFAADVTSESATETYVSGTVKHFGRLDAAFLNAGISYASTSIFDTTEESYERIMRVNVKSGKISFVIFSVHAYSGLCLYHSTQRSSASSTQQRR
jgi:NAD(P)-dependent dehydrogenase (short-subunit alcohol dehydrogenase family)